MNRIPLSRYGFARLIVAGVLSTCAQALWLAAPTRHSTVPELVVFLLPMLLVSLAACAALFPRSRQVMSAAVGSAAGALLVWVVVLVQRDAQEVGTLAAAMEGLLMGVAIGVPGSSLFLLLAHRSTTRRWS